MSSDLIKRLRDALVETRRVGEIGRHPDTHLESWRELSRSLDTQQAAAIAEAEAHLLSADQFLQGRDFALAEWDAAVTEAERIAKEIDSGIALIERLAALERENAEKKRLLQECATHLKGHKMSMLARTTERLRAAIETALQPPEQTR